MVLSIGEFSDDADLQAVRDYLIQVWQQMLPSVEIPRRENLEKGPGNRRTEMQQAVWDVCQ